MRKEPLLTAVPPVPVASLSELYAIAFDQAQKATQRYGALATQTDERLLPVRSRIRGTRGARARRAATACPRPALPPAASAPTRPICAGHRSISSLRPKSPISANSSLATPYTAWALAARHRQRAFVFWTYVIALAEDPLVRLTAEDLAREALSDGNLWRRERRLAWRAERNVGGRGDVRRPTSPPSAALLESLLRRDIIAWSQGLTPAQRDQLLAMDPSRLPPHFPDATGRGRHRARVRRDRSDQAPRAAPRRTIVEHLSGRCRQRRRPKQHGIRAKTGGAVHHAARGIAQYCSGIGLATSRPGWPAAQIQIEILYLRSRFASPAEAAPMARRGPYGECR